jgi:hypothetical protein
LINAPEEMMRRKRELSSAVKRKGGSAGASASGWLLDKCVARRSAMVNLGSLAG